MQRGPRLAQSCALHAPRPRDRCTTRAWRTRRWAQRGSLILTLWSARQWLPHQRPMMAARSLLLLGEPPAQAPAARCWWSWCAGRHAHGTARPGASCRRLCAAEAAPRTSPSRSRLSTFRATDAPAGVTAASIAHASHRPGRALPMPGAATRWQRHCKSAAAAPAAGDPATAAMQAAVMMAAPAQCCLLHGHMAVPGAAAAGRVRRALRETKAWGRLRPLGTQATRCWTRPVTCALAATATAGPARAHGRWARRLQSSAAARRCRQQRRSWHARWARRRKATRGGRQPKRRLSCCCSWRATWTCCSAVTTAWRQTWLRCGAAERLPRQPVARSQNRAWHWQSRGRPRRVGVAAVLPLFRGQSAAQRRESRRRCTSQRACRSSRPALGGCGGRRRRAACSRAIRTCIVRRAAPSQSRAAAHRPAPALHHAAAPQRAGVAAGS